MPAGQSKHDAKMYLLKKKLIQKVTITCLNSW